MFMHTHMYIHILIHTHTHSCSHRSHYRCPAFLMNESCDRGILCSEEHMVTYSGPWVFSGVHHRKPHRLCLFTAAVPKDSKFFVWQRPCSPVCSFPVSPQSHTPANAALGSIRALEVTCQSFLYISVRDCHTIYVPSTTTSVTVRDYEKNDWLDEGVHGSCVRTVFPLLISPIYAAVFIKDFVVFRELLVFLNCIIFIKISHIYY